MALTTRGWALVGAATTLYVAGRIPGTVELAMMAAGLLTAVVFGWVVARFGRPDVTVRRELRPARLFVGVPAHAAIEVVNRGDRRTPVLAAVDRFTGRREARFAAPPLDPQETARGAYRVPTRARGVYTMGPLEVAVTDPLGLVRRSVLVRDEERVTIFPRIERVSSVPVAAGPDLVGGAVASFSPTRAGNEFHSLREYAIGDDLRRVHWRSTARTGQLMIREHDVPWQTRATLLVDDRGAGHDARSLERSVEAAASIAHALHERASLVRLLTPGGVETPFGAGHVHETSVMERLAVLETSRLDRMAGLVSRLHRQAGSGALVVFAGTLSDAETSALATLGRRFGFVAIVRTRGPARDVSGVITVDAATRPFAEAWNAAMSARAALVTGSLRP